MRTTGGLAKLAVNKLDLLPTGEISPDLSSLRDILILILFF
jgi:hypothetical protein